MPMCEEVLMCLHPAVSPHLDIIAFYAIYKYNGVNKKVNFILK